VKDLQSAAGSHSPTVGILALQGCVQPHVFHLESLGAKIVEVKTRQDLDRVKGLIIPGGESTTLLKLITLFDLEEALIGKSKYIPFWGICAGAILMAKNVSNPAQKSLGIMDFSIERNAYGRQLESFNTQLRNSPVSFIRAPKILSYDDKKTKILDIVNEEPVSLVQNKHMITCFHPELSQNKASAFHQMFLNSIHLNTI